MDKTPMLTGQPMTVNDFVEPNGFSLQFAQCFGNSAGPYAGAFMSADELTIFCRQRCFLVIRRHRRQPFPITLFVGSSDAQNQNGLVSTLGGTGHELPLS